MHRRLVLVALGLPLTARALPAGRRADADAAGGLRQVLEQGVTEAVARLGRPDGFLGDPAFRIPLPDGLKRVERVLRATGQGRRVDELIESMNRAAEAAVPHARVLLVDTVRRMTLDDAAAILTGGDDAATRHFRERTADELARRMLPIVHEATERAGLARHYDRIAAQATAFGVLDARDAKLDAYVTRKALDGLFAAVAEQERAIRADPAAATGSLARRVLGALR